MRAQDLNTIDSIGGDGRDDVAIEHHLDDIFSGDHPVRRYPEIDPGNVLLSHMANGSAKLSTKEDLRQLSESRHINGVYDFASVRDPAQGSSRNAQYPTLYLCDGALGRHQFGLEERSEATVLVGAGKPGGDAVGVMLIAGPVLTGKAATP